MKRLLRPLAFAASLLLGSAGLSANAATFTSLINLENALTSGQLATKTTEDFEQPGITLPATTLAYCSPQPCLGTINLGTTNTNVTVQSLAAIGDSSSNGLLLTGGPNQVLAGHLEPNEVIGNNVSAIVFDLPEWKTAWGADFTDDPSSGNAGQSLVVDLFNGNTLITSYDIGAALLGDGFFGSLETASFNKLVFRTASPAATTEGQAFQMDNLVTYVPEPSAAVVFAANFVIVGWITRRAGSRS